MSSATPRRDGNDHDMAACHAGECVVHDFPMHTHPIVGEHRVIEGGHDNMGFAVAGDHGKVQDCTLQRAHCQHARIMVHVVLLRAARGPGRPRVAPADTHGHLRGAVHVWHVEAVR